MLFGTYRYTTPSALIPVNQWDPHSQSRLPAGTHTHTPTHLCLLITLLRPIRPLNDESSRPLASSSHRSMRNHGASWCDDCKRAKHPHNNRHTHTHLNDNSTEWVRCKCKVSRINKLNHNHHSNIVATVYILYPPYSRLICRLRFWRIFGLCVSHSRMAKWPAEYSHDKTITHHHHQGARPYKCSRGRNQRKTAAAPLWRKQIIVQPKVSLHHDRQASTRLKKYARLRMGAARVYIIFIITTNLSSPPPRRSTFTFGHATVQIRALWWAA